MKLALGDLLYLEVCMDVDEPRDVIWEKDGDMLRNENEACRADMGFDGACNYLRIHSTESQDAGLYEVYGERGAKEVSFYTTVQVGDIKVPPLVSPKKRGVLRSSVDVVKTPPKVLSKLSSREGSVDSGSSLDQGDSRVKSPPPAILAKPRRVSKDVVSDDQIVPVEESRTSHKAPLPAVKPKPSSRKGMMIHYIFISFNFLINLNLFF